MKTTILDTINSPKDLKKLSIEEKEILAEEIREGILNRVNIVGGHLGPDLGIVEATIALHSVFNSPKDKFIFDVSHQCYPHKMLTGRKQAFIDPLKNQKISGYFNPQETEHDTFVIGHTSTSISLATGVAKARDLRGEDYNVIALIGDGSLSGGEAFEGLNNASVLNSNIIIIVNDNEMSIAENQGGLYKNLKLLRDNSGKSEINYFKSFGFDYYYLEEGNNISKLIEMFERVKDTTHPTVVHIHTLKGKGFQPAIDNKELGHWSMPGILNRESKKEISDIETYESITKEYVLEKQKRDKTVMLISPATPGATGFSQEMRKELGKNYTDVGIAEEHAIAYSSALAKYGCKPILGILSSFIQRTYDQISQDLCLNNSPATILVYWGAITGADMTHLGCFDIPLISNIPNIVYLAPTCKEEYLQMLDWSVEQTKYPVAIRVPYGEMISTGEEDRTDYSILNKSKVIQRGKEVAIFGLGTMMKLGKEVCNMLKEELKIEATLINPKFITGVDTELLEDIKETHKIVITLEDGVIEGGYGQKIASKLGKENIRVLNYGAEKEFTDRIPVEKLYKKYRLDPKLIIEDIKKIL